MFNHKFQLLLFTCSFSTFEYRLISILPSFQKHQIRNKPIVFHTISTLGRMKNATRVPACLRGRERRGLLVSTFGHGWFLPPSPSIGHAWREPYAAALSSFNVSSALNYCYISLLNCLLTVIPFWSISSGIAGILSFWLYFQCLAQCRCSTNVTE